MKWVKRQYLFTCSVQGIVGDMQAPNGEAPGKPTAFTQRSKCA